VRQRRPAQEKWHVKIDGHCLAPVVVAGVTNGATDNDAGIVDQAIKLTELVNSVRHQFVAVFRLGEFAGPGDNPLRHIGDLFEATFVATCRHNIPAILRKSDGNSSADAGTCARDQYNAHVDFP
jgi:hypothetical protein